MRQYSRIMFRSLFRVKVSDRHSGKLIGYARDVCEDGLRLICDLPVEVGAQLGLSLRMRAGDGSMTQVELNATCLWVRENPQSGHQELGLQLLRPGHDYVAFVERLRVDRGIPATPP